MSENNVPEGQLDTEMSTPAWHLLSRLTSKGSWQLKVIIEHHDTQGFLTSDAVLSIEGEHQVTHEIDEYFDGKL